MTRVAELRLDKKYTDVCVEQHRLKFLLYCDSSCFEGRNDFSCSANNRG
jgi:hypothetical protein